MLALALALALAAPGAPPPSDEFASALAEGEAAWAARADPAKLEAAIAAFERAQKARPGDAKAALDLARAYGLEAISAPKEAAAAWDACGKAAERALRALSPGWVAEIDAGKGSTAAAARVEAAAAEPLYWLALALYSGAQTRGFAAVLAVKDSALAMMERAAALDERVDAAGPHRALGAWLSGLPAAAGGGAEQGKQHFDRARSLFPAFRLTDVREAETLCVLTQDKKRFEELLGGALGFDEASAPGFAAENRAAKRLAKELLAKRDRLF